jgi:hypothetical protein
MHDSNRNNDNINPDNEKNNNDINNEEPTLEKDIQNEDATNDSGNLKENISEKIKNIDKEKIVENIKETTEKLKDFNIKNINTDNIISWVNKHKIGIIIGVIILLVIATIFKGDDELIKIVQDGSFNDCPKATIGKLIDNYMGSPKWKSFTSDDGNNYVNVTGDITYVEKKVKALIQFKVDKNNNSFEVNAVEFNEVPQSIFITNGLLESMCNEIR